MTERYCDRPDSRFMNGKFAAISEICLAEFASHYYKNYYHSKKNVVKKNDCQLEVLTDDTICVEPGVNPSVEMSFPQTIKLMSRHDNEMQESQGSD